MWGQLPPGSSSACAWGPGGGVVAQQYAPDAVAGREYYQPGEAGAEQIAAERLAAIRQTLRGVPHEQEE